MPKFEKLRCTLEDVRLCMTNGNLDNPNYQDSAFDAETYFEFKDEMASKGIKVFNAEIEHFHSSKEVQALISLRPCSYLRGKSGIFSQL